MIRILLTLAAFLTVTVILLIMQPDTGPDADVADTSVTRATADPLDLARATASDTRPRARPVSQSVQPAPRPLEALSAEAIRALATSPRAEGPILLPGELRAQIIQAIGEGRDDAYIEALLRQAVEMGETDVPTALITRRGRLDTHAILEELERKDQSRTVLLGAADDAEPVRPQVYTVEPGDSLAAIARKFYGRTEAFQQIFEANRATLGTPDNIRPGQLLTLPDI